MLPNMMTMENVKHVMRNAMVAQDQVQIHVEVAYILKMAQFV